jgi:hypothetical protein
MRRIYAYFISLLLILIINPGNAQAQDTILFPLKIKIGLEVSGPAIYAIKKDISATEGYISADLNERISAVLGGGYLNYKYLQYNYVYYNEGIFMLSGVDYNLLAPEKSMGKYWVGISLRYGLSIFNSQVPSFQKENYWGMVSSSIAPKRNTGHFIEASPGVRVEVLNNFTIGWTINLRMLLYTNTGKDLRPIYFPGFGNGTKMVSSGFSYFIVWNIPFKKINAIIKKEVPEETEDTQNTETTGTREQSSGFR